MGDNRQSSIVNRQSTDAAIAREVLAGDREAFRALVERHQARVLNCVRRIIHDPEEAEDIAQETFVKAYTHLGDYDTRWAFTTWLLTIATRTALNAARARQARPVQSVEDLPPESEPRDESEGPRASAARNEWLGRLQREIKALSEKMRIIFSLRHEDDLSIREIARVTGSSESAVKVTLHRARKILMERLKEFSDFA
ncbi:MAG: RNA polymerase sigma factor [Candidatus Sumerlaeota bacterium]|nr:RNA polymerase sigma factor [Candidatus Sumerlaeota bacterium]